MLGPNLGHHLQAVEKEIANFSSERDVRIKAAKDKLKAVKATSDQAKAAHKCRSVAHAAAQAELDAGLAERAGLGNQLQAAEIVVKGVRAPHSAVPKHRHLAGTHA